MRAAWSWILAGLLVAAAVVGAVLLWHTDVPGDLAHPTVDVARTFGARATRDAASVERVLDILYVLGRVATVLALVVYARYGTRYIEDSAAGPIGTGFLLAMLGFCVAWIARLPFDVATFAWAKHHDILDADWFSLLVGDWTTLGGQFIGVCLAVLVAMGLARWLRRTWWAPAAAGFVALAVVFAFIAPLTTRLDTPTDPGLRQRAAQIAAVEGVRTIPLEVQSMREVGDEPNAYAFGIGSTRRVVLWDTILSFPHREVDNVVAHEYGHQAHHHILKSLGWVAIALLLTALVVAVVARRRGGMARPEAIPVAILAYVVIALALTPLQAGASRRYEAEADWAALNATRDPSAMQTLMIRLTHRLQADPDPPGWFHVLFDDHPSGVERVRMARAWAARYGSGNLRFGAR